jgi:hypothetical protein
VFPNEPGTLKQLSDLFWLQGDVTNEYDYLRKEVERNPARGDDPAISMALAFGGVYRGADVLLADFEKQVDQEKLKQMGTVVRVHWLRISPMKPTKENVGIGQDVHYRCQSSSRV